MTLKGSFLSVADVEPKAVRSKYSFIDNSKIVHRRGKLGREGKKRSFAPENGKKGSRRDGERRGAT